MLKIYQKHAESWHTFPALSTVCRLVFQAQIYERTSGGGGPFIHMKAVQWCIKPKTLWKLACVSQAANSQFSPPLTWIRIKGFTGANFLNVMRETMKTPPGVMTVPRFWPPWQASFKAVPAGFPTTENSAVRQPDWSLRGETEGVKCLVAARYASSSEYTFFFFFLIYVVAAEQ